MRKRKLQVLEEERKGGEGRIKREKQRRCQRSLREEEINSRKTQNEKEKSCQKIQNEEEESSLKAQNGEEIQFLEVQKIGKENRRKNQEQDRAKTAARQPSVLRIKLSL